MFPKRLCRFDCQKQSAVQILTLSQEISKLNAKTIQMYIVSKRAPSIEGTYFLHVRFRFKLYPQCSEHFSTKKTSMASLREQK